MDLLRKSKPIFLPAGLKIELIGPIQVRRGVLLLKPSNVRIVGGHVTELDKTCSLVQQLTDKLGQDNAAVMLAQAGPQQPNVVTSGGVNDADALFADDEDDLFNAIDIPAVMWVLFRGSFSLTSD